MDYTLGLTKPQQQDKIKSNQILQLRNRAEYEGGDHILQNALCSAEAQLTTPMYLGVVPTFPQNIS